MTLSSQFNAGHASVSGQWLDKLRLLGGPIKKYSTRSSKIKSKRTLIYRGRSKNTSMNFREGRTPG